MDIISHFYNRKGWSKSIQNSIATIDGIHGVSFGCDGNINIFSNNDDIKRSFLELNFPLKFVSNKNNNVSSVPLGLCKNIFEKISLKDIECKIEESNGTQIWVVYCDESDVKSVVNEYWNALPLTLNINSGIVLYE